MSRASSWRDRERRERRRDILRAARTVFEANDYEHTTMEEIAERADIGKGTIYLYFAGGKEQLLYAVLDDLFAEVQALARRTLRPYDALEASTERFLARLNAFLEALAAFLIQNHGLVVNLIREVHRIELVDDPERTAHFNDSFEQITTELAAYIEAGVTAGVVRPVETQPLARVLLGGVRSYVAPVGLTQNVTWTGDPEALAEQVAADLIDVWWRGMQPTS